MIKTLITKRARQLAAKKGIFIVSSKTIDSYSVNKFILFFGNHTIHLNCVFYQSS